MNKTLLPLITLLILFMLSNCKQDELPNPLDRQLKEALNRVSADGELRLLYTTRKQ